MKVVNTSLNEKEYRRFKEITVKLKTTPYAVMKRLLKQFLEDQKAINLCILYLILCYSLAVATVTLI